MWGDVLRLVRRLYPEWRREAAESEQRAEMAERQVERLEREAEPLERIRRRLRPLQSETDVGRHRWPEG